MVCVLCGPGSVPVQYAKVLLSAGRFTTTDVTSTISSCTFTNVQTVLQLQDTEIWPLFCFFKSPSHPSPPPPPGRKPLEISKALKKEGITNKIQPITFSTSMDFSSISFFIQTHCQQIYTWKRVQDCDQSKKRSSSPRKYCLSRSKNGEIWNQSLSQWLQWLLIYTSCWIN